MLFVALGTAKEGTTQERVARRLEWDYPEGAKLVAEYWLQCENPSVISIFEADSVAPIMASIAAWDDVLDLVVIPAVTHTEGMEIAKKMMA
jgi:hypothetical protein